METFGFDWGRRFGCNPRLSADLRGETLRSRRICCACAIPVRETRLIAKLRRLKKKILTIVPLLLLICGWLLYVIDDQCVDPILPRIEFQT